VTRLVILDLVLLAAEAAYVAWVSWVNRGLHIKSFSGRSLSVRDRWFGTAVAGVVVIALVIGTNRYGFWTKLVNAVIFITASSALDAGGVALHNRTRARR